MATNKLVSIITPAYNMECYIFRLLDSILTQKYRPIEFILVNDGSTDNTEKIIKSYTLLFQEKNITLKYIYQENSGQAAAINAGLKVFTGDYLVWPDSDDFMCPDLIGKMAAWLENHTEYGLVRTNINIYKEMSDGTLQSSGTLVRKNDKFAQQEDLFEIFLFQKRGCWFEPGGYMVRADVFFKLNPARHIYPSRGGQNFQMLLPVLYSSKCGYIDEALHNYLIRKGSHSSAVSSVEDAIMRNNEHEDILLHTLDSIAGIDKNRYKKLVMEKYHRERLKTACHYRNIKEIKRYFAVCRNNGLITGKDYVRIFIYLFYPCFLLLSLFRKTKASLRRIVK